jgi:chlorobactene glucosyltransferase
MYYVGFLLLGYGLATTLLWIWRFGRWLRERKGYPSLDVSGESLQVRSEDLPLVSVLVPVRNEERNIPNCLRSLLLQSYPRFEIIIVDDHSTDETVATARALAGGDPRVSIIESPALPPGWIGKSFALHQAARLARGDWFLFTDADVAHSPEALSSAIAFARRNGLDLLSLSPLPECVSIWEKIIQPRVFELLNTRFDLRAVNDRTTVVAAANGQFILIRRQVYASVGGHAAVRSKVLEDVEIAKATKAAGFRIFFANTRSLATTRMYVSLSEIWAGWSKNLFQLLDSSSLQASLTILNLSLLSILPFVASLAGLIMFAGQGGFGRVVQATAFTSGALLLLIQTRLTEDYGQPRWLAMAYPLGTAMLVALIANSWYRNAFGGGVTWKGRRYGDGFS